MSKYIFLSLLLTILFTRTFAQNCNVTISPQDLTIDCGQTVDLFAVGLSANPALDTDFNNSSIGAGWSTSATVVYNNPCGPSLDGSSTAWFGEVPFPRTLTTNGFDMSCGGEVCFDLDFADDDACGNCDDCEDPDLADEGVFFQYSTNGGATWTDIFYFDPLASNDYYEWDTYCFTLPAGAHSASTLFQWSQPNATTEVNDHWGIDNVTITPTGCGYWYDWDNIAGSPDGQGQTVSPGETTTYTVTYTDGTDVCTDDITVTVNSFDAVASATDVNLGCGDCTDLDVELTVPPAPGSVCQEVASASGVDCDNFVTGIYAINCVPVGNPITSIEMDGSVTGAYNCGDYGFDLVIDGNVVSTGNCVETDIDLTPYMPFSSVEIVSENLDFFCDNVTLDIVLDITYGSPNYVYSWTPTTDMTGANSQTPNVCPTATTTYTGTITETNTGCSASDAVTINITNGTLSLSCPAGLTAQCDISEQPAYANFTDFQNAGGSATTTGTSNNVIPSTFTLISENTDNGSCPETVTRVYQIEDDCGNIEQCTQVITIEDTTPPVFAGAPGDVTVECIGDVPAMINLGWTDNCDGTGTVAGTDGAIVGGNCGGTITRTWTYTDACGNPATTTQTITVDDTQAPVFDPAPVDVTVECIGDVPAMTNLDWTDNCDGTGTVAGTDGAIVGGNCGGTITRTWTYTDACGNPATTTQTITVDDTQDPVFDPAPVDVTVECIGDVPAMTNLDWTDNCDGTGTVAGTDGAIVGGNCGGTITRTWTYTDVCGNPATTTQTITVDDTQAPVFDPAPVDVTVECIGDVPAMTNLGWTDNCDGTGTVAGTDGAIVGGNCGGTITRTWTYTDACGNPATTTQTITVDDTQAPVFDPAPGDVTVECIGDVPAMINLGWTDNCDGTGTVAGTDGAIVGGNCGGTITRTWTYTDACGNPATTTQTITVDDTQNPVFDPTPVDITVECIGDVPAMINLGWTDNCDGTGTVAGTDGALTGGNCGGTITRTWTYTDACGNPATTTQIITVDDTQDPTASNPDPISATGTAPAPDITVVDDEADNCTTNPTVAFIDDVSDGGNCPEIITRTYSVTDDCNNQILVEQTITIGDADVPTASNPDPINVQCAADVPAPDPTVVDDEADNGALPTVTWEDDTSDGNTCPEVITRRYRVTDDCGNFIFVEQEITINDTQAPVFDPAPVDVTVECIGDVPAMTNLDWTDNCDGTGTVAGTDGAIVGGNCGGTITRAWTYTDACGNPATTTQTITVDDTQAPVFDPAPVDVTVECIGDVPAMTNLDWTDNCDGTGTVAGTDGAIVGGNCGGTITRTWTYTDACGNPATTTQTITVDDTQAPVFDPAPVDVTVECIGDVPAMTNLGWTDNCDGTGTVAGTDGAIVGGNCGGTITRTWTYTDACGNPATTTQTITVDDTQAPVFDPAPGDVTVECIGDVPAMTNLDWTDNCDGTGTVAGTDGAIVGGNCGGTITRTWTYTDACGNPATTTQTITVDDTQAPVFDPAPGDVTVECIGDVPAMINLGWTDNCDGTGTVAGTDGAIVGGNCGGTITRTWTYTDACGNPATTTQTITVDDTQNPVFDPTPVDITVECIGDVPAMINLGWTDNCDGTGTVAGTDGAIVGGNCGGTITRTWTYTDACGNPATTTQTITVDDTQAPTASNPATTTVECASNIPVADPAVVTDEADNCTVNPTVTFISETSDNNVCNGEELTRTYEVEDECGNTTTVTHTIVIDSYTPIFTVAGTDPTVCGGADGFITISGLDPNTDYTFEYNGGASSTITTDAAGEYVVTGLGSGSYTGFTVSDADCPACSTTDGVTITLTDPNPPAVDAGVDQQVCAGSPVTLTAINPDGATITWDNGVTDGTAFTPGVGTVTYTVTADLAGCINSDVVEVTVVPTIDALTCPGQLTAVCDITEQPAYADFDAFIAAGGSATIDPAGEIDSTSFVLLSEVSDGNTCPETVTRTYQIADTCGVTVTCTQNIVIHDLVDPTASNPAPIAVQCIGDVPASDITVVTDALDNCSVPTVTHVGDVSDGNTCPEVITRTYRVEDACGNFIEVEQLITINDDIDPVGTAPVDETVQCLADVPAVNIADLTGVSDNCGAPTVTHVGDVSDGNTCPEVITRTYRIEDACGNFIEVDQIITVGDDTDPTASNPAPVVVECDTDVPAPDVTVVTDALDNCSAPIVTHVGDVSDGNVCNGEVITRTYRVEDACGNFIEVEQTITIDSYTPTFTVAGTDPTLCGGTDGFITISGLDPNTDYTFEFNGGASSTITTDAAGEYVITGLGSGSYTGFTVSDVDCPACSTTDGLTITLTDPNPPAVDAGVDQQVCAGSPVTLTAINPDGATITWDNGVTDGTAFTPGVGTVTYTVTANLAGCINTDQVDVMVVPTIDAITCPGQLTAVCDITEQPAYADFDAFIAAGGSATIDPAGEIDSTSFVMISEVSDGNTCPETVTRTYQIADTCGVTVTCTQDIVIHDLVDPTASNPAPISVQCIGDVPASDITVVTDALDNCSVPTVTHVGDVSDGNTCPEVITRTYRVEDACGNFIEVEQTITINDDIDPVGTAPVDETVQCLADVPAVNIADLTGVSDNCGAPTVTHVGDVSDGNTCPEVITRTYRIEDACGNFIEVDQIITVGDDIDPTASNPAAVVVECDTDVPAPDVTVVIDAADNCSAPTVTHVGDVSDGNVCNGEVITRTYRVEDACGNFIEVDQTITIDSYTPTFTVAGTDPTVCGGTDGFITISGLDPTTDYTFEYNGGTASTITTDAAGEYVITGLGSGSYTGFTVSDVDCPACSTTDGITITLTDPNPPAVDAGVDQQVCAGTAVTLTANNPDGANITWDNGVTDGTPFNPGVGTVTYTVTADLANCISTDQVDVTVYAVPAIDALADQEECDSYTLPAITGTDLTGNEAYYDATNGGGTQYNPGDAINTAGTTTLFIYDETGTTPNCFDEQTFDVTINLTPVIDALTDQEECDSYTLPAITGTDLTGNEAYYDAPNGGGTQYNAGDAITAAGTTTLYIYDETGTTPNCFNEQSFDVTINLTPVIDPLADQEACDSYTLPAITGTDLTGNEAYYDAPSGGGTQYNAGDNITASTTLYIYDETATTPNCFDEQTFDVTINLTPVVDPLADQVECDSYTLPAITGTDLTGNEAYYDAPNGGGTQYNAGDNITAAGTTTLYIYDETATTPNCSDEQTFDVTINITPTFTLASTDPTTCGGADGTITISGLVPNTAYDITYSDGGVPVGPNNMNSDAAGELVIGGLTAGSYSDFVVTLNGCTATDNSAINLVDPNAPAVDAGVDQVICKGDDVTLTADNPDGAAISWDNGVNDGVAFTPVIGTVTYTVTAELLNCISTDQVNVTVNPLPDVNAGNDLEICEGDPVVLSASGADSYSWDNGVVNGESFTPDATTTYTVTGSTLGCESTDVLVVTVVENPVVVFEADRTTGCVPLTVNLTSLTSGNIVNCTYTFSDGTVLSGCDVTHTFVEAGCYDVTLEVENSTGCISSTIIQNYICVENYPIADFDFEPGVLTNIYDQANFTNTSIGGNTYEWTFGDGEYSTDVDPTHTFDTDPDSGKEEYEVTLIAISEYGCADTVSTVIPVREELIYFVPNTFTPDGNKHNSIFKPIFTSGFDPQDYTLMIFNRWGELIFESRKSDIGWDGTYGDGSNEVVKDGTYVWKIEFKTKYNDERKVEVGHVNLLR